MTRNEEIIALRKTGVRPRDIARQLGVTPNVVAGVLHRARMTHGSRLTGGRGCGYPITFKARVAAHARNHGLTETARAWGLHIVTVWRWRKEMAA